MVRFYCKTNIYIYFRSDIGLNIVFTQRAHVAHGYRKLKSHSGKIQTIILRLCVCFIGIGERLLSGYSSTEICIYLPINLRYVRAASRTNPCCYFKHPTSTIDTLLTVIFQIFSCSYILSLILKSMNLMFCFIDMEALLLLRGYSSKLRFNVFLFSDGFF